MDGDGEVSPPTVRIPLLPLWWKHPREIGIHMGKGRSGTGVGQRLWAWTACMIKGY